MLVKLQIRNFALISELTLDFNEGLTVVTGETGSGKSILLGALGLALGERSSASSVRHGTDLCVVEATFISDTVNKVLGDYGLGMGLSSDENESGERNEGGERNYGGNIIIRREVSASGRSRAFVNDSLVNLSVLREVGLRLVDLHGQDETRALLDRDKRLDILDDFGKHLEERDRYRAAFAGWRTAVETLRDLEKEASKPQGDRDYLQYQLEELSQLGLESLDQEELEYEYNELIHATELAKGLHATFELLDGGAANSDVVGGIELAIRELEEIERFNKGAGALLERLRSVTIEVRDIAQEASSLAEGITHDPNRLALVEDKMEALSKALHKHNSSDAKALAQVEVDLQRSIDQCDGLEKDLEEAKEELGRRFGAMQKSGETLMSVRGKSGAGLIELVHEKLAPLKLPNVEMSWQFTPLSTPDLLGIEDVELLFSANPGSPPQAMSQVASGGERSRVMLAFKAALATKTNVPTIVLDEIDTGVSGDVATRMAQTMMSMSKKQQVFSVTHLAQVAASGKFHLEVSKTTTDKEAITKAEYLDGKKRTESIATMLSGSQVSEEARAAATVLLNTT
ncbi:MAG TPA: DNA repair protein RecN [Flavobacteriales bacterium]|nr:DNA repair protein RecN [Flavobacteriales bacterium]